MKTINKNIFFLVFLISLSSVVSGQTITNLVTFCSGGSKGKVAMAISGSKVYTLYTNAKYFGAISCYDLATGTSTSSGNLFPTIGKTDASHNDASIAIDGNGYIHAWIGMHNTKMKYWRSNSAGDINNFTEYGYQMPGYNDTGVNEKRYSYPAAATASNGDVFVILRRTALILSGGIVKEALTNEKQDLYRWNNQAQSWSVDTVCAQTNKNAYMSNLYGDSNNNIHIVTAWSQRHYGANTFQRGTYLKYNNSTATYSKADGASVIVPAGVDTNPADVFYPGEQPWNDTICEIQTPMVKINGLGKPIITVAYNSNYSQNYPSYRLDVVRFDGTSWNRQQNVFSGIKNYERPPLTSYNGSVNIYARNTAAYILKSTDNGATFPTNKQLTSGSQPVEATCYNSTTDVYVTPYSLYKVVFSAPRLAPRSTKLYDVVASAQNSTAFLVSLNSTKDILQINNSSNLQGKKYDLVIYNMLGKQVLHSEKITQSIDVSNLAFGHYLLVAECEGKRNVAKFTK
jgi:hypothetical protein